MQRFPFGLAGFLVAVAAVGLLGDLLVRDVGPVGINLTIWGVVVLGMVLWQAPRFGVLQDWSARIPLAAALFFAMLYSWRDAEPLKLLIFFVVTGSIMLTAAATLGRSLRVAYVLDYIADGVNFVLCTIALPFAFFSRTQDAARKQEVKASPVVLAVMRGVLISVPLLLVFGGLLVSADVLFESYVKRLFDVEELFSHVALTLVGAWLAAGVWALCLTAIEKPPVPRSDPARTFRWGVIEINIALSLLTVLFAAFIAVQLRYFFGGHEHVLEEAGLTYADYARTGFFELAWVAAIALALLGNCARVMDGAGVLGKRGYKIISAVLTIAMFVIIASAFHRMSLYIDAYGLTRLRLYTASFMIWMVIVFLWLYFTIFRERVRSFAWGFLLSGYAATFLFILINPDRLVAAHNLSRAIQGATFTTDLGFVPGIEQMGDEYPPQRPRLKLDTQYIGELSADAIPIISRRFEDLNPENQAALRQFLSARRAEYKDRPIRTWTFGLHQARVALQQYDPAPESINP